MQRKKPTGSDYKEFVAKWDAGKHADKVSLAKDYNVSYDTAKHWRAEGDTTPMPEPVLDLPISREPRPPADRSNEPTRLVTAANVVTTAMVIGDMHHPYHDNTAMNVMEAVMADVQPNIILYNGDVNDFYQVSDFAKDPARLGQLQSDLDMTIRMFLRHRQLVPDAKMIFIEGTHENRWVKYLQLKAPAVSKLDAVSVPSLYKLAELDIQYVPFERGLLVNGTFLILHGDIVSKHSSWTAKAQSEKNGGSGMCNHTHRGGSFFQRDRFGTTGWWENFCLCDLNPDWVQNPNWQQGFSLVHFMVNGRFFVEQVPIVDGKAIHGCKLYTDER